MPCVKASRVSTCDEMIALGHTPLQFPGLSHAPSYFVVVDNQSCVSRLFHLAVRQIRPFVSNVFYSLHLRVGTFGFVGPRSLL